MKFNDRLRELRKGKGLTQDEFSKQSGLTRSAISMYERGEREPNFETLEKLADFFNGIMVIPNLLALLFLSGKVVRLLKEYNEGIPFDRQTYVK